jgi:hypothetical protein
MMVGDCSSGRARKMAEAEARFRQRQEDVLPHQLREAARRRAAGETLTDLAKSYSTTHATILRSLQRLEAGAHQA